jgi:phenylalanyl-tRNA synthetase beta chain
MLERLGINNINVNPVKGDVFSEGLSYKFGKAVIAEFGIVKNSILKHFGISQEVLYANIKWDQIIEVSKYNTIKFKPIPKYPEVKRDFALLLDESVDFVDIFKIAKQTEKQLLKSIDLFDVYTGNKLPNGKKSYAVSFVIQDEYKTLTDKQIDKIMAKLQNNFEKQLGAELR